MTKTASSSVTGSTLRVCMAPYAGANPYQQELVANLKMLDCEIATTRPQAMLTGLVWRTIRDRRSLDLVHLHWLPRFGVNRAALTFVGYVIRLFLLRLLRRRFVWTVHDLYDPEARWRVVDRWLARRVFAAASIVIAHAPAAARLVAEEFRVRRTEKIAVIFHANYINCYPNSLSREAARARLGLDSEAVVFLFFGAIRIYKGVPDLVAAFGRLPQLGSQLLIAGKPWSPELLAEIERQIPASGGVQIHAGFIADDEVQLYMKACDVVVLPYREYLTSGAVVLAMSFARACIAPNAGSMADVLDPAGAFLYPPDEPDGLRQAMETAVKERARLPAMGAANLRRVQTWDWAGMARETAAVYRRAVRR